MSLPPFLLLHAQKALSLQALRPLNLQLDFLCNGIVKPIVDTRSFRKVRHDLSIKVVEHLIKLFSSGFHENIISKLLISGNSLELHRQVNTHLILANAADDLLNEVVLSILAILPNSPPKAFKAIIADPVIAELSHSFVITSTAFTLLVFHENIISISRFPGNFNVVYRLIVKP